MGGAPIEIRKTSGKGLKANEVLREIKLPSGN